VSKRRSRASRCRRHDRGGGEDAGADLESMNSDIHASEDYRRAMIPVFTRRALEAVMARVCTT
jgi:hypothetical protein